MVREPEIQKFWSEQQVYESLVQNNPGVSCVIGLGVVIWAWGVREALGIQGEEVREHSLGISTRQLQVYQPRCTAARLRPCHRSKMETMSPQQDGDRVAFLGFKLRLVSLKSAQCHLAIDAAAHPPVAGVAHLHSPQAWTDQCLIA